MTGECSVTDSMPGQPNVLLVMVDQMRWDCAGFVRNDLDGFAKASHTPNLIALAREGVVFEQAYCASPVCSPARASWLTGLLPHAHQQLVNYGPAQRERFGHAMRRDVVTLGDALHAAGYACGIVGPWHLGDDETPQHGFHSRWETVKYVPPERDAYKQYLERLGLASAYASDSQYGQMAAEGPAYGITHVPTEHQRTTWTIDRTIDFCREQSQSGQPFFAFASVKDPHPPIAPPRQFVERYDPASMPLPRTFDDDMTGRPKSYCENRRYCARHRGGDHCRGMIAHYLALIEHIDDQVGRLLRSLDDMGVGDDTLVCFISDHGEMMGDHGMMAKGTMLEASVRVPWVMRWRAGLGAGVRVATPVSGVDLAPTLAALAGTTMPDVVDGRDLSPALRGATEPDHVPVVAEIASLNRLNDSSLPDEHLAATVMVRDGDWKCILHRNDLNELYNLADDPHEMHNLAADAAHAGRITAMRKTLHGRLITTGLGMYAWV